MGPHFAGDPDSGRLLIVDIALFARTAEDFNGEDALPLGRQAALLLAAGLQYAVILHRE